MRLRSAAIPAILSLLGGPLAAQLVHQHAPAAAAPATVQDAASVETAAATKKVATPTLSPAAGSYAAPLAVTLATATAGATIYYTTNGSAPTRSSTRYSGPFSLGSGATVKAIAFKSGMKASSVASAAYQLTAPPSEVGGTLYLTTLTPQSGATTGGAGAATLTLTADETAAYLRYTYNNLTGVISSQHIHGPDGAILFDVDTAAPLADGARLWRISATGTYTAAAILAALKGGQCYLNLHTAAYPSGEIKGFFRRVNGSQTFTPPPAPPTLPGGTPSEDDAARLLMQATYGAQWADIAAVRQKGYAGWIDEQMAMPQSTPSHLQTWLTLAPLSIDPTRPDPFIPAESLIGQAVTRPDQLRQRMVLALSELFVVSLADDDVRQGADGLADYVDTLGEHAFGNYRELLEAVTTSPVMGVYLDMLGSTRSLPELGRNPNENYAREVLQLFSIGLFALHPDGSLKLDGENQPIPTYDQEVVEGYAKAFTGWTFGGQSQLVLANFFRPRRDYRRPMEPWTFYHDAGEKKLLDGTVLPIGQSPSVDMEQALDSIFQHPNVGPFVCRFLIQRLVTSNPSPAYVYRCGQVFANDGTGERGDLGAVVRAILLDYEARSATLVGRPDQGHLREPAVRFLGLLRTLQARQPRNGRWRFFLALDRRGMSTGQVPLVAPTVFNFFEPGYALPGEIAQAGLVSPEFQVATETTVVGAGNLTRLVLENAGSSGNVQLPIDVSALMPPQVSGDSGLLDRVDLLLFGGAMSADTRASLAAALADPTFPVGERRVIELVRLASISPESVVQK